MRPQLPPGPLADLAHDAHPLARARELVAELLEMVGQVRAQAADLEAERDQLRRQLADAPGAQPAASTDEEASPPRARHGDLGRALAPILGAPRRSRPGLVALLGDDTA